MSYYQSELARIHHEAFSDYARSAAPGVLASLGEPCGVVELGCGGGALTRPLLDAGHRVIATDASSAMLDLARQTVPEADIRFLKLPDNPIPPTDAVVAVGTVFNYLDSEVYIDRALLGAARAGRILITDLLDLSYGDTRQEPVKYFHEGDGWKLWTVNSLETPDRVVRQMTIETADGITKEVHVNVLVDVAEIADKLRSEGLAVSTSSGFGYETLPPGFVVLEARRPD